MLKLLAVLAVMEQAGFWRLVLVGCHSGLPNWWPGKTASPPEFIERYSGAIGPVKIIFICAGAWTLSPR